MELLKLLNAYEILVQVLSFLLLFWLLKVFFWKKFLKIMDDRKLKIAAEFEAVEKKKAEMEKLRLEFEDRLTASQRSADIKIQEAIREGRAITEEFKKKAELEAEKIIESAKNNAREEVIRAKEGLKDEIVGLVLGATERIIEEKVSEEKNKKMVQEFIKELDRKK